MAELSRAIFHHVPTGETNISTALPYELNGNEYGLYWLGVSTEYTVVLNTYFQHFPCTATIDTERLLILLQTVYGEVLEGEFPSYAFGFKIDVETRECTIMVIQLEEEAKRYDALSEEQINSVCGDSWLEVREDVETEDLYGAD